PDRAAVARLNVSDLGADLPEDRPRPRLGGFHQLRVRGHGADRNRAVGGEVDSLQLLEILEVDQDVRRGRPRLHDVDQRLPAGEGAGAVVLREQAHSVLNARRASVLDLPEKHAIFSSEIPAQVKNPAIAALSRTRVRPACGKNDTLSTQQVSDPGTPDWS